jgi:hypothetical protein
MTPSRLFTALALSVILGRADAWAETPLFNDGTAFGGSQVFSEGLNPLGNAARFDQPQPQPLYCFSYVTGDQRSVDNATALKNLNPQLATTEQISGALRKLVDSPWGIRTRSYGVAFLADTVNASFTHEEFNSVLVAPDALSTDLDSTAGLAQNTTRADLRRVKVDRIASGIGSLAQGVGAGFSFRVEKWNMGTQTAALVPTLGQVPLDGSIDLMGFRNTSLSTTTELAQGVRLGGTLNRLNAKRIWDVQEKPQGRIGLQMDIGTITRLSIESDVNDTMRMPFPVKQRTSAASLRLAANPTLTLIVGAERKKFGDAVVTKAGASLQIHLSEWQVGFGMQFSKDRPLQGISTYVH